MPRFHNSGESSLDKVFEKDTGTRKTRIESDPDPKHVSTSFAERQNLTMRMHMRRFTRLTNAFSKKFESHVHMVALYAVWYNFVRQHKSLRVSPAMAAGLTDRLWSMGDSAELVDAAAPKPGRRGPYKKSAFCCIRSNAKIKAAAIPVWHRRSVFSMRSLL
jgi:hypothetical protein